MASGIWHLACQTYALKLFNFHRSLNQTQFLFSSARSFRVAKSETFSVGLSPRSRRLPLLFKFSGLPSLSGLLRLFRFPKSALFFVVLLLSYSQGSVALTAQTSRAIEGTAPYLTFDGGRTKVTDTDSLLYIRLQDGTRYTPSTNPSSSRNPIRLPYAGSILHDIGMLVPSSVSQSNGAYTVSLSDLVTRYNYWRDDDGDGQGANGVTATGDISVSFTDKDGNTVSRIDRLSKCRAPYKVTLRSTGGSLTTQYGVPRSSSFSGATVDYYINPYEDTGVCYFVRYARPNLSYGTNNYAGPSWIWNPSGGFLTQSNDPSYYYENFPTTGADGLYFYLTIDGANASQFTWSVVTDGDITATVDSYGKVTLHGPRASSAQINSDSPSPLDVPDLPQKFELVGRDSSGNEVRYGFVLKQWFVNRGNNESSQSNQSTWCRGLGYRLPQIKDLVKYGCTSLTGEPCSGSNNYTRIIDYGFFGEWGRMNYYADAGFGGYYWTSDASGSRGFAVRSSLGGVDSFGVFVSLSGVCTAP
ncbi:hypothetical protein [Gilliamella sp. ESL0254]|uniref:hypothetical protein n=1 Tax=Gilliamella sp. ESL0254 TaxID=2705035 RepID=UPI00158040FE|nr:hypothetical protein [Gilliamella sp. ESL0254]NUF26850.1 hypothetical protein [Gilliamella sp. ESL0254]